MQKTATSKRSQNNLDGLIVTGKGASKMNKNFRHGSELRDSIANINQERIQAQIAQTQMHATHSPLKSIPQYQTLQVFKEKRPAAFADSTD